LSAQKAFGIQRSQSVSANGDINKEAKSSLHPAHRGISVITPPLLGRGRGRGQLGTGEGPPLLCVLSL